MEPCTAEVLEVEVKVGSKTYTWTPLEGLDPRAVESLRGYIYGQARRRTRAALMLGHSVDDLVQAGYLGAVEAARLFDAYRGTAFITFAHFHIVKQILQLLNKGILHVAKDQQREWCKAGGFPEIRSLSDTLRGRETTLEERLVDPDSLGPMPDIPEPAILRALRGMTRRDALVVTLRYGLGGAEPRTLAELGRLLGLSRERIRQIEQAALVRLRRALKGQP